jgi:hypothetical protein
MWLIVQWCLLNTDKDLNMAATQEGLAVEDPNDHAHLNDLSTP